MGNYFRGYLVLYFHAQVKIVAVNWVSVSKVGCFDIETFLLLAESAQFFLGIIFQDLFEREISTHSALTNNFFYPLSN